MRRRIRVFLLSNSSIRGVKKYRTWHKIRFCSLCDGKQGRTAVESYRNLCNASRGDLTSENQCQRWFQRSRSGNKRHEKEPHSTSCGRQSPK